jgi:hypothetical protein
VIKVNNLSDDGIIELALRLAQAEIDRRAASAARARVSLALRRIACARRQRFSSIRASSASPP